MMSESFLVSDFLVSDCFAIIKWLLVYFSLQISTYILIKIYFPKYALALSFTASLLFFTLITWYTGFFGLYPTFSFILVILILFYGLLHHQRIFTNFWAEWKYYALFLFIFFSVLLIKIYTNTNIINNGYGEPFVDHAFIAQIMQNPVVPPYDPWFAGYRLNFYYYLSYWLYSMLGLISGIPSNILINLIAPTIAAITVINLYALGKKFIPKLILFPVVGLLLVSPAFFYFFFKGELPIYSIFVESKLFTRYPLYLFLYHLARPHIFSLGLQSYLILLLSITIFEWQTFSKKNKYSLIALTSLGLGSIFPISSWLVIIWWPMTIIFGLYLIYSQKNSNNMKSAILWLISVILISSMLYLPFILQFENYTIHGIEILNEPFDLVSLFLVFGWFIIGLMISLRKEIWLHLPIIAIIIPFFLINHPVAGFMVYLLILIVIRRKDIFDLFAGFSLMSMIFCSFFIFKDGEISQNNTLLKFSMLTWILLGTSVSIMIGREISSYIEYFNKKLQLIVEYGLIFVLISLLFIPGLFFIAPQNHNTTLDGSAWLKFKHPSDAQAISYLKSLSGNHIIVETPGTRWTYRGRVSTFSGIPTILGYKGHEFLWRNDHPMGWKDKRTNDIKSIYESSNTTIELMKKYNADLLYVGSTEKQYYRVDLPESGLCIIYKNEEVTIYKIC
jgi:uncharacterized membrane protein